MGNIIRKIKNRIVSFLFERKAVTENLTYEKLIESGKINNFHGNNKVFNITIGKNSYVSFNSIIYHTTIGSYCSIGPNVVIGYGNHPTNMISTSPHVYLNELLFDEKELEEVLLPHFKSVIIANDVWIGANVYIKNGVQIGNGAIIGAGAVVLKDVSDYEIVAGVPAKVIRKRFNDDIIELLLKSEWWRFEPSNLKKYKSILINPNKIDLEKMIKELLDE